MNFITGMTQITPSKPATGPSTSPHYLANERCHYKKINVMTSLVPLAFYSRNRLRHVLHRIVNIIVVETLMWP